MATGNRDKDPKRVKAGKKAAKTRGKASLSKTGRKGGGKGKSSSRK